MNTSLHEYRIDTKNGQSAIAYGVNPEGAIKSFFEQRNAKVVVEQRNQTDTDVNIRTTLMGSSKTSIRYYNVKGASQLNARRGFNRSY